MDMEAVNPKTVRWPPGRMTRLWIEAAFSRPMAGACGSCVFPVTVRGPVEMEGRTSYGAFKLTMKWNPPQ